MLLRASSLARYHASPAARRLSFLSRHLSGPPVSHDFEYDLLVLGGGSGGLACSKEGGWVVNRLTPISS